MINVMQKTDSTIHRIPLPQRMCSAMFKNKLSPPAMIKYILLNQYANPMRIIEWKRITIDVYTICSNAVNDGVFLRERLQDIPSIRYVNERGIQ